MRTVRDPWLARANLGLPLAFGTKITASVMHVTGVPPVEACSIRGSTPEPMFSAKTWMFEIEKEVEGNFVDVHKKCLNFEGSKFAFPQHNLLSRNKTCRFLYYFKNS